MPDPIKLDMSQIRTTTAILYSVGRTMHSAGAFCAFQACARLGMEPFTHSCAYWSQSLMLTMRSALKSGVRYIVTADGDSIYDWRHVTYLWSLMETNPRADAIAALQCKRRSAAVLMDVRPHDQANGEEVRSTATLEADLVPATVAHFGLTVFRCDALRDVPQPWFLRLPNERKEGETVDEDVYFWRQWIKHQRTLYIASRCNVGHLAEFILWPGADGRHIIQEWNNYNEAEARPKGVRPSAWEMSEQPSPEPAEATA